MDLETDFPIDSIYNRGFCSSLLSCQLEDQT